MFVIGLVKVAAPSIKTFLNTLANREISIHKALEQAGKKFKGIDKSPTGQKLRGHVNHPISIDLLNALETTRLTPESSMRHLKSKSSGLSRLYEHAQFLQKTTRNPESLLSRAAKEKSDMAFQSGNKSQAKHWASIKQSLESVLPKKLKKPGVPKSKSLTKAVVKPAKKRASKKS